MQNKKTDAILVRLPPELREQARQLAERQDKPLAQIVRELLREKINKEGKK